jgi:hypothetical protein
MTLDLNRYRLKLVCLCMVLVAGCAWSKQSETDLKERDDRATYHYNLAYGHYFDLTNKNVDASL